MAKQNNAGFSLLELLIVIALLGLLTWLGAQTMQDWKHSPIVLRAGLSKPLQDARSDSIQTGRITSVSCNELDKKLSAMLSISNTQSMQFQCSSWIRNSTDNQTIYFYPDGSSSGGELSFALAGVNQLTIDWLTSTMSWESK